MSLMSSESIIIVIGAFLVLKEILQLINWGRKLTRVDGLTQKLWDLHNVKDEEGLPVWYFRKSIDKLLSQLAESQSVTNSLLTTLATHIDTQNRLTEKMIEKLENIEDTSRKGHQKILDTFNEKLK